MRGDYKVGDHIIIEVYSIDDGWIWIYFDGQVMENEKCNESVRIWDYI